MITRIQVIPYRETLICDICGSEMVLDLDNVSAYFVGEFPSYPHRCVNVNCRAVQQMPEQYPRIVYEAVPRVSFMDQRVTTGNDNKERE